MTPNIITTVRVPATTVFPGGQPVDLCSLNDLKEELQITDTSSDTWLAKKITQASGAIATYCNRTFQVQAYRDDIWPFRDDPPRKIHEDLLPLQLTCWPLANDQSQAGIAPPQAPGLSCVSAGSLAATRYFVRITYVTTQGETAASIENNLSLLADYLPIVASPPADRQGLATGWNCYMATSHDQETLQNVAPLPIGTAFTLPASGLVTGATLPNFILVSESGFQSWPLAEGVDFVTDAKLGRIERLHHHHHVRSFSGQPLIVEYSAGYAQIPDDLQDAAIQLVKARWYARTRDPMVREENIQGVYSAQYWFGTGPGAAPDMPNYVAGVLDRYRVQVFA